MRERFFVNVTKLVRYEIAFFLYLEYTKTFLTNVKKYGGITISQFLLNICEKYFWGVTSLAADAKSQNLSVF
eukprot:TRINITY_DN5922_c0_g1_i1.p1 TRINITY_DN5922_c0_g1~~TRINITY_DN5922_c0_g1_i1.p1  ORF type:complete len:72 (+),score=9.50 TRINITY_DN5922_c0_g1_i1:80-295(+)